MKSLLIRMLLTCAVVLPSVAIAEGEILAPEFCGGFYADVSWLYLKSVPTDGDLQTGTLLTLTDDPANLHAVVQQLEPDRISAFRAHLGYAVPCSNCDYRLGYFHFSPSDRLKVDNLAINQFFQNFLGGAFTTLKASGRETIDQVDLNFGKSYLIHRCLMLRPYVGVSYADISRKMRVKFTGSFPEEPQTLKGKEKSDYCGVGLNLGTDFSFPLFSCIQLEGNVGGGLLFGNVKSRVRAKATDEQDLTSSSP